MRSDTQLTESFWQADTTEELLHVTLSDVLRKTAAEVPDRIALVDGGVADPAQRRRWTYAELVTTVERTARALLAHFQPGERVAICAPNSPAWILLQLGLNFAGLVLVPINPAYRAAELEVILASSGAAGIFHTAKFRDNPLAETIAKLRASLPALREAHLVEDFERFTATAVESTTPLPELAPDALLQIQFTSGTAGVPKGAQLHHHGTFNTSRFVALRAGFPDGGVWLNAMPLFHVGGAVVCEFGTWAQRGTFVIAPGFDPGMVLELIESEKVNTTLVVPTMILALLTHPDFPTRDHSSMVAVLTGAAMVSADLVRRTRAAFECALVILFGQTELNGVVSVTTPQDSVEDQSGTVGRPLPQADLRIIDEEGKTTPVGVAGEIVVRGYQCMMGYSGDPELSAQTLGADGWLHTGDVGTLDSRGYLRISARLKDMIIRGGMNLYPREIEDVLGAHEDVADVSVIGIPNERWGEIIAAVVRPANKERPISPDVLHAYCREKLAAHKAPAVWFVVDAYPMTPSGKIQKFMLQKWVASGEIKPLPWSRMTMTED
jgi:fatty-acyl-CoA synthase